MTGGRPIAGGEAVLESGGCASAKFSRSASVDFGMSVSFECSGSASITFGRDASVQVAG